MNLPYIKGQVMAAFSLTLGDPKGHSEGHQDKSNKKC